MRREFEFGSCDAMPADDRNRINAGLRSPVCANSLN
jgi:hypothetical protein